MRHIFIFMCMCILYFGVPGCSDYSTNSEEPTPPSDIVREPGNDDETGKIYLVDRTGKRWDITDAVNKYGFVPEKFGYGLGPKFFKPFTNPQFLFPGEQGYPADDATDTVIGVELAGGENRAYALSVMRFPEVVNDRFYSVPVAVCFCPLIGLTGVYKRTLDGQVLTLSSSGWVYNDTFVLYDYETETLWYPLPGESGLTAISGHFVDRKLPQLPSVQIRWKDWIRDHRGSRYLQKHDGGRK